jgi:hypothetical protein
MGEQFPEPAAIAESDNKRGVAETSMLLFLNRDFSPR